MTPSASSSSRNSPIPSPGPRRPWPSFRSSLLEYLAAHTLSLSAPGRRPQQEPIKLVVLIISETLLTTTSASADSLTAHRLLGPEMLWHPGAAVIEFNAVAPSLLTRALELVVRKEARKSGRRRTPGPLMLKRLGEIGDIRSAVSSLEFLCLKGDGEADWGAKVAFTRQKRGVRQAIGLTRAESETLELVTQREASLGIFHAVVKVVYNKRDDAPPAGDAVEELAPFLARFAHPRRSQVAVDALVDETGTDTHTFVSALHENYLLSCDSTGPVDLATPIDYVGDCIGHLSLSYLLCPTRDVFFGGRAGFPPARDAASHLLRQNDMTFHVAVRGLFLSLPNPVRRRPRARRLPHVLPVQHQALARQGGDGRPRRRLVLARPRRRRAARREMLLERLPYMAHVTRAHRSASLRDLERVVAFHGPAADAWVTDRPADDAAPRRLLAGIRPAAVSGLLAQKLVLSDDDIED